MKIDPETKHQKLAQHVKFHLDFLPVEDIKVSLGLFVGLLYDVPWLLGMGHIRQIEFFLISLPVILIIHIWVIRLLIKNRYSTQMETVLFMGIFGLLGSISLFVMVMGMLYYTFEMTSLLSYILVGLTTLLFVFILVAYQIKKFSGDPTKERKRTNQGKYAGLMGAAPGTGYLHSQTIKGTGTLEDVFSVGVIYFLALFLFYFAAKFLHRYVYINTNMKYVVYQPVTRKKRKKVMKQGLEIK